MNELNIVLTKLSDCPHVLNLLSLILLQLDSSN